MLVGEGERESGIILEGRVSSYVSRERGVIWYVRKGRGRVCCTMWTVPMALRQCET